MKMRENIKKIFIIMLMVILGLGTTSSFAMQDYQGDDAKALTLSYFRYANGDYKDGYALNTTGAEGESHHPIYQIMSGTKTNYYCLNATAGDSWVNGTVGTPATYNRSYNLNLESDLELIKNDSSLSSTYKNTVNSQYLKQILWILDNIYIPNSTEQNDANKKQFLAKAGIVYGDMDAELSDGTKLQGYRYIKQPDYDYSAKVSNDGKQGYFYFDKKDVLKIVELPDELIEVAQQTALWYFTNYLDNNEAKSETYNVKDQWLPLVGSNSSTNTNTYNWKPLDDESFDQETSGDSEKAKVGKWLNEQAAIVCNYLIDAANNYANNSEDKPEESPLKVTPATANITEKIIDTTKYYIVGPIKIETQNEKAYELSNTISINNETDTGAYISDAEGTKDSSQVLGSYVGKEFYLAIPKNKVTGDSIKINFEGSYNQNNKTLWISTTKTEQPVVEVDPGKQNFELTVNAGVKKEFDLALRKSIKALKKAGAAEVNSKLIANEAGKLANRKVTYIASDIEKNGTATYNHRKDPVVVEKEDVITYEITIYNEGDMNGYASEIIDKLPQGLKLKGEKTGTYESGNIKYSYVYDETANTITFTNVSKNVLNAYDGGSTLSSETIEIECEVTQAPDSISNTYLTNIAYISKEYNSEANAEVTKDRDSDVTNIPSAELKTTGDKYNGYHGGNNKNEDNNKNVYNDGTNNDDYFPGREDDDDFEIVVIKPAEFDLALQKYITSIYSNGTITEGRQAPKIDTTNLANKTATTATYTQDKTPIQVKHGDYVTYTFTVYNEGDIDGYVNKIRDNIPTGLQFVYQKQPLDEKTLIACDSQGKMEEIQVDEATYELVGTHNAKWEIDKTSDDIALTDKYNGESTISVTCNIKENGGNAYKKLSAYDSSEDNNYNGDGLDRTSVTLVLRVSSADGEGKTIRNEAAITEAEDANRNKQDESTLKDRDSQTNQWPGKDGDKKYQDDEDYDNIILKKVDLALTKFITAVSEDIKIEDGEYLTKDTTSKNAGSATNPYTRATKVDTSKLKSDANCHDATYTMVKDPLTVPEQSYVLYNIRVYNEGETDVYAGEIKDYLPNYLDYIECDFNTAYGWKIGSDGKTVTTSYLAFNKEDTSSKNLLKAFDKQNDDGAGSGLDYRDVQILCRVNSKAPEDTKLVNSAEITKYQDKNGEDIPKDIDSKPENLTDKNQEKREEDDDDWEVIKVEKKKVDLALTKFITAVSNDTIIEDGEYLTPNGKIGSKENPYTRATKVDTSKLKSDPNCHDATYTMIKDPLTVPAKSYVLYNIRVYNEGGTDVYAGEITDHLPDYLDYVDCDFNTAFKWNVGSDGKTIKTTYLAYNKDDTSAKNLLKAFNKKTDNGEGSGLDYRDVQVLCRVNDKAPTNTNIVNVAEITKYEDDEGNDIPKDIDSTPDNVDKDNEDDDDYEVILIKTFDLSLLKYVSTVYVTEDGKTTTTQTGNTGNNSTDKIPKVEVNKKKLNSTVVKFGYTIKITNEGDIAGYAKEITDYVPQGLKFYAEDNQGWTDEGNNVISTRLLENTLLQPGESAQVTVILRWINGSSNLGLKTNTAEISEDYNDENVPDRDSTPDNKKEGEDDIDDASILLSIKTGIQQNIVKIVTMGTIILVVLSTGIILIKKYVL